MLIKQVSTLSFLLILLGASSATNVHHKHHKSLTERASESEQVDAVPLDGSDTQVDM
jgi:hypothetical protein